MKRVIYCRRSRTVDRVPVWRRLVTLFLSALTDFSRNNCPYVAAGIAYWTLFSLFPLVLAGISILGFMYPSPEEQRQLVEGLVKLIPVSEDYLAGVVSEVAHGRGTLGLLAVLGWCGLGPPCFPRCVRA